RKIPTSLLSPKRQKQAFCENFDLYKKLIPTITLGLSLKQRQAIVYQGYEGKRQTMERLMDTIMKGLFLSVKNIEPPREWK
ncbi:hypothetical protein, partial [Bacillus cereus group sp. Bce015]|uniref:hypothetical protein n=1 Tax=Bacillus cereus group sp. Bce015 TaxID=3445249 RepID=UPI003F695775